MDCERYNEDCESPIQRFYAGKSILITGGTGFLGKVLIEKLLRSCPNTSTIYLLMRPKREKSFANRLDDIFQSSLYDIVKKTIPDFRKKIVPIQADFNMKDLGISEDDKNLLIHDVAIIFHVAATIRFDEELEKAILINVNGTRCMLDLAKRMKNLKSFIHVSTIYSNCYERHIEERFYPLSIDYMNLLNLSKNVIDETKANIAYSKWPNTYTFTKALAEMLIEKEAKNLPIAIVRPSVVMSCASEPFSGWTDSYIGATGLTIGFICGLIRFVPANGNIRLNIVPVDYTINALIASAWHICNRSHRKYDNIQIYNYMSHPMTLQKYFDLLRIFYEKEPMNNVLGLPYMIFVRYRWLFKIYIWCIYFLIMWVLDIVRRCMGKNSIWKICKKYYKMNNATSYFLQNEWTFSNNNVRELWNYLNKRDQQLFAFNMVEFDWEIYCNNFYKGLRRYIFNESDITLKSARIKYKRLRWMSQIIQIIVIFIIFYIFIVLCNK